MPAFGSSSGGIVYHFRALAHRRHWKRFIADVSAWSNIWLLEQIRNDRRIELVGPSAGYTLPWRTLRKCPTLHAIEPDPIARAVLRRRHPTMTFDTRPGLGWNRDTYDPVALDRWFDERRDAALVFCNLLGQISLSQTLSPQWTDRFQDRLRSQVWLSFHDIYSANLRPQLPSISTAKLGESNLEGALCPHTLYAHAPKGTPLEVCDHLTKVLLAPFRKAKCTKYFAWQITPGRWHLIEGICTTATSLKRHALEQKSGTFEVR